MARAGKKTKEAVTDSSESDDAPSVQAKTIFISFGRTHKYFIVLRAPLQISLFLIINL